MPDERGDERCLALLLLLLLVLWEMVEPMPSSDMPSNQPIASCSRADGESCCLVVLCFVSGLKRRIKYAFYDRMVSISVSRLVLMLAGYCRQEMAGAGWSLSLDSEERSIDCCHARARNS